MITLQNSKFYHIYNFDNNHQNLFESDEQYRFFLKIYDKYISPIADTYAWVLMQNHFHLLIRVKETTEIPVYKYSMNNTDAVNINKTKWETSSNRNRELSKTPDPTKHFSHLFNTYSKFFNSLTDRSGALFSRPFKRTEINCDQYLKKLLVYIHCNPVHHGFVEKLSDYKWSSYHTFFSSQPTKLRRSEVINWFDDLDNFEWVHIQKTEYYENIKDLLLE
ncbi:MAG TPA: hypothetical protein VK179_18790 [Bacteroidales bacterium]|nr:hypothetical protein [Bacteroidales bacterium]